MPTAHLPFRIDPRKGKDAASILEMIRAWALLAEKYRAGEITKDDYDKWRYNYPQYDAAEIWAHVPSQELSDALVKSFQEKLRNE